VVVNFLTELEDEGYVKVEVPLLNGTGSEALYTLLADEEKIRSNYFCPQQKISHHVCIDSVS
jgi:hypothetical protein